MNIRAQTSGGSCAVYYVTDENFALPTLVSATALRRWVAPATADIRVVAIDIPQPRFEALGACLESYNIALDNMGSEVFSDFDTSKFNKTHVPRATLGRFFMLEASPKSYDHIIYIDGDTWINDDPAALIEYRPPAGRLAAVEGPSSYYRNDISAHGRETRDYLAGIGLGPTDGYFNAGVLSASTATWKNLSADAFAFFQENTQACKYHDESALNAVAKGRRTTLSHRWNFTSPYRYWDVEDQIEPALYHFTGAPKPWTGPFVPWEGLFEAYRSALAPFSALGLPLAQASDGDRRQGAINAQDLRKLNTLLAWRKFNRQRAFARIEQGAVLQMKPARELKATA